MKVLTMSLAAIGLGLYGMVAMILQGMAGGHFEGYIVLMGLILAGHGASAIAYTLLTRRIQKPGARRIGEAPVNAVVSRVTSRTSFCRRSAPNLGVRLLAYLVQRVEPNEVSR